MLDVFILPPYEKTFDHSGVLRQKALAWDIDKACTENFEDISQTLQGAKILSPRVGEVLKNLIDQGQLEIYSLYENWQRLIASN